MSSFITYLKNVRAELSHVVWPIQRQAMTHVVLILLICIALTVFIAALDLAFTRALEGVLFTGF